MKQAPYVSAMTGETKKYPWPAILGGIAILGSAFCFYLTTIVVRLSAAHVRIEPAYFTFSRFLHGFVVVLGMMKGFYFLFACAASGILGQYLITLGFRYVTAVEGGIISSSRILMAAFLGPFLLTDPPLTISGWVGALLIFMANTFLAIRKINQ